MDSVRGGGSESGVLEFQSPKLVEHKWESKQQFYSEQASLEVTFPLCGMVNMEEQEPIGFQWEKPKPESAISH